MEIISRFFSDDSGSNALEYSPVVALTSLVVVTGAANAGTVLGNTRRPGHSSRDDHLP
jgi:Flp pilus assembly pilin Flp